MNQQNEVATITVHFGDGRTADYESIGALIADLYGLSVEAANNAINLATLRRDGARPKSERPGVRPVVVK